MILAATIVKADDKACDRELRFTRTVKRLFFAPLDAGESKTSTRNSPLTNIEAQKVAYVEESLYGVFERAAKEALLRKISCLVNNSVETTPRLQNLRNNRQL